MLVDCKEVENFDAVLCDLFVIDGSGRNLVDDFNAFDDMAKRRELSCELGLIGDDEKKFRTGAIRVTRQQRRRNSSLGE